MLRREFLPLSVFPALALGQQTDTIKAGATEDRTIRVALVRSDFKDSEDHFGANVKGLADPRPVDSHLSDSQLHALVLRALELGSA